MKTNNSNRRIDTTLGELVATVGEFAFEYSTDTKEAYDLARVVLIELLQQASFGSHIIDRYTPGPSVLH